MALGLRNRPESKEAADELAWCLGLLELLAYYIPGFSSHYWAARFETTKPASILIYLSQKFSNAAKSKSFESFMAVIASSVLGCQQQLGQGIRASSGVRLLDQRSSPGLLWSVLQSFSRQ